MNMVDLKALCEKLEANKNDIHTDMIQVGDLVEQKKKEFPQIFLEEVERGLKKFDGDFFLVRHVWRHKLNEEPQDRLLSRKTCERPTWRQTEWRFDRKHETWELLWTLPDQANHLWYKWNALQLQTEEEKRLLHDLLRWKVSNLMLFATVTM